MPVGRMSHPYRRPTNRLLYSGLTLPSTAPAEATEEREKKSKYESSSESEETAGESPTPGGWTKHPRIGEERE
jgi:hypothetical protein